MQKQSFIEVLMTCEVLLPEQTEHCVLPIVSLYPEVGPQARRMMELLRELKLSA